MGSLRRFGAWFARHWGFPGNLQWWVGAAQWLWRNIIGPLLPGGLMGSLAYYLWNFSIVVAFLLLFIMYVAILAFGRPIARALHRWWMTYKPAPTSTKSSKPEVDSVEKSKPLSHWENRQLLKKALTEAYKEGLRLSQMKISEEEAGPWVIRTYRLIKEALGEEKAEHFLTDEEGWPVNPNATKGQLWVDGRLNRLHEIIGLVDSVRPLKLQPDFDGREWVSKR